MLLGAETTPVKSRALLAGLGSTFDKPGDFVRHHPLLSPSERKRLESLDYEALERGLAKGVEVLTEDAYPEVLLQAGDQVHPALFVHGELGCLNAPTIGAQQFYTKTGGGGEFNSNFEVVKNFRLFENFFWSDGAGRYLFGEAPNFIIRSNGSPSLVHSGSTVDGFEWTLGKSLIYGYYGGIYVGRNTALDANGTSLIGYGYRGSPNSQNRTMQEGTLGITQTLYRDPRFGQVSFYLNYAYFWRTPWSLINTPKAAHQNAIWFDLRYTFPGSAPAIAPAIY